MVVPSASMMAEVSAVSSSPTRGRPVIVGAPVAVLFAWAWAGADQRSTPPRASASRANRNGAIPAEGKTGRGSAWGRIAR